MLLALPALEGGLWRVRGPSIALQTHLPDATFRPAAVTRRQPKRKPHRDRVGVGDKSTYTKLKSQSSSRWGLCLESSSRGQGWGPVNTCVPQRTAL